MKPNIQVAAFLLAAMVVAPGSSVYASIDLEEQLPGVDMHNNGSSGVGGHIPIDSQGAEFSNFYQSTPWVSWGGFSMSSETDTTTSGFANQYSAWPGSGADASTVYAVGFMDTFTPAIPVVTLPTGQDSVASVDIANTTYAALVMRDGDATFGTEKFGGVSGDEADWFKLTISGYDAGDVLTNSVDFYLADYRFTDNSQDYILDTWTTVDLSALGNNVRSIEFTLDSSDTGAFGLNTPAYFALDNLQIVPEPGSAGLALLGLFVIAIFRRENCS